MGHAHLTNISTWMARRIYAKGKLSIREMIDGLKQDGEQLQASEGPYSEYYMLAMGVLEVIHYWFHHCCRPTLATDGKIIYNPVIEPVDMTPEQRVVFQTWLKDENDNIFEDNIEAEVEEDQPYPNVGGRIGIFESIKWKYTTYWRKRYKDIPLLSNMTN